MHTIVEAYNKHRHLRLRVDDIWTAILIQFNFFVHGRSKKLRTQLVAHQGKKELVVYVQGNWYTVNFGAMAKDMTRELEENLVDPSLRASSMKKYFDFKFSLMCGLPDVTLEGAQEDWEERR